MAINKIFVEVRKKLQACQFYVHSEFALQEPQVSIEDNTITIKDGDEEFTFNLSPYVILVSESLGSLNQYQNILTFRVRCRSDFEHNLPLNEGKISTSNPLSLPTNTELNAYCRFCNFKITMTGVIFNRVLPLPSSGLEEGDFFCHQQDNSKLNCLPRDNDCLYGPGYVCLHNINLMESIDDKNIICNCSAYLGYKKKNCIILWTSSVYFHQHTPDEIIDQTLPDFLRLVNQNLALETVLNPIIALQNPYNTDCLIVWVIEKNLQFLKISSNKQIEKYSVRRILHRLDKECSKTITNNPSSIVIEASPHVIQSGYQYLQRQSTIFPTEFRAVNGYEISFLMGEGDLIN